MARRILIILAHPDPHPSRFCRALAAAYAEGARGAGFGVELLDLALLDIPFLRSQVLFEKGPPPKVLEPAIAAIRSADHLVLIFPLWLGTMPALLKAFLEQVMRPGVAFAYRERGFPAPLLAGTSARIIVTMGMPAIIYRLWYRAHGLKCLERGILRLVGVAPVRRTLLGSLGSADDKACRRMIEGARRLGADGA